jgi:hypothetical protein
MIAYTLQSAISANAESNLKNWLQDYLRSEGKNHTLANYIQDEEVTYSLEESDLLILNRIMGPESSMKFFEAEDVWEERVRELQNKIMFGEELPPLIVTNLWSDSEIADGAHRHEALIRQGHTKYWTVFCLSNNPT